MGQYLTAYVEFRSDPSKRWNDGAEINFWKDHPLQLMRKRGREEWPDKLAFQAEKIASRGLHGDTALWWCTDEEFMSLAEELMGQAENSERLDAAVAFVGALRNRGNEVRVLFRCE